MKELRTATFEGVTTTRGHHDMTSTSAAIGAIRAGPAMAAKKPWRSSPRNRDHAHEDKRRHHDLYGA